MEQGADVDADAETERGVEGAPVQGGKQGTETETERDQQQGFRRWRREGEQGVETET